jgi:glycerate 2-kinase
MLFTNYDALVSNGCTPVLQQKRKDVLEMLTAAVDAVHPYHVVRNCFVDSQLVFPSETIDLSTFDNIYVVGFGKASVGMARAVCDAVPVVKGIVITNDPSAMLSNNAIEVFVGGHPLPNEGSIRGAEAILNLVSKAQETDCVIVLISGGGSSLFCKPRVPLSDLQKTMEMLFRSGATINDINTIRKHLSSVKGGLLISHIKAVCVSLLISDIVHDPITSIASGPTAPDPTTFSDAWDILIRYNLWESIPITVRTTIDDGVHGRIPETLKDGDPAFDTAFHCIVANNERACQGALRKAIELGYDAKLLTTSLTGEARMVGQYLVKQALSSLSSEKTVFISGGETTVTMSGNGVGGRNQELVLSCVKDMANKEFVIASFATDGIDGNSTFAGALVDGCTLARAKKQHLNPITFLESNNSSAFFQHLGDGFRTGITGTNVMDVQLLVL